MQSKATTVTEYLKTVPADRLDALLDLRDLCLQTLKGFKEGMQYGMPSYSFQDQVKVAWNSQKDYIYLYIYDVSKSSIRYKNPSDLDFNLIEKMLQKIVH